MNVTTHHDLELAHLKERLLLMAGHAERAVDTAISSLIERTADKALRVIEDDSILDQLEKEIDELSIRLLLKAPLATELRFVTVAIKISRDLERIGDEATTIARRTLELNVEPQLKPYVDIPRMARIALEMLKEALDAFVNHDTQRACQVIPRHKEVDAIHRQLQRELASFMIENPKTISRSLNLMTISKALERIADHATNIAEDVIFMVSARDVRHHAADTPGA